MEGASLPKAREDGLVVEELHDEVLIYDLKRHRAYCLNRTAALVWRHCDGQTPVAEMAELLEKELTLPADEKIVRMALDRLARARLLRERVTPPDGARSSRREFARKLALVGGLSLLLPVVSSIVAPTPVEALSCTSPAGCCGPLANCQAGGCVDGTKCCCPDAPPTTFCRLDPVFLTFDCVP